MSSVARRAREVLVCAVLVSLPLVWLRYSGRSPSALNVVDRALLKASTPLQAGVSAIVGGVRHLTKNYIALVDLRSENQALSDEVARLRGENAQLRRAAEERARLEGLLRFQQDLAAETLAARIIGRETTPFFRVTKIQLDRGKGLLRPGMPVLAPAGLVGRIHRVYGRYSDVLLAVDAQSAVDVVLPRTRARGLLRGAGYQASYRCRFEYLAASDKIEVGDLVVTSGVGGKFPKDLVVGKVAKVTRQNVGVFQEAEVEPAVDFSKLEEVLVMVTPPLGPLAQPYEIPSAPTAPGGASPGVTQPGGGSPGGATSPPAEAGRSTAALAEPSAGIAPRRRRGARGQDPALLEKPLGGARALVPWP